jgi:hypothetical protein
MKIFAWLFQWIEMRRTRKVLKEHQTVQKNVLSEFNENIARLYAFVVWLNSKGLPTRKIRKSFWKEVMAGKPVMESLLKQIKEKYEAKESDI